MAVAFNGITKRIAVTGLADFVVVDVEKDLYSAWKVWVIASSNAKYLQAFRPIGGDATGGTQTAPPYFFLMNNWKVEVDGIENLGFNTNLYCEEATNTTTNPFVITGGGSVISKTSDAPVNTIEVSSIAMEITYDGVVVIDVVDGESGTGDYVGTLARPSNNLADAMTIASNYNIHKFIIESDLTLDRPANGYQFKGNGSSVIDLNNQMCNGTSFETCEVTGIQNSSFSIYINSRINELTNFAGTMTGCFFLSENPITVQPFIPSVVSDCRSAIAGSGSMIFDFIAGNISMNIRAFSGGVRIRNSQSPANIMTLEYIAGRLNMDNTTNTFGTFHVRGVVDCDGVEQPIQAGLVVTNNGALSQNTVANAVLNTVSS